MSAVARSSLGRDLGLVAWQIRYEQRAYWRNRTRGVFTFVFPIMFLVIFASLDRSSHVSTSEGRILYDQFFVPGILAYGVITTSYVNMAMGTAILQEDGVLKRMQGTPLPHWAYTAARIGSTVLVVAAVSAVMLAVGAIAYSVPVRGPTLPGLLVTLVLGTAAFTTLGIGIVRFIPNAESAPVIVNLSVFPLTFISGIWFPVQTLPKVVKDIAAVFPLHPLADGLEYAFNPATAGPGFNGSDLLTLGIWTVVGVYLMLRYLRKPQGEVE